MTFTVCVGTIRPDTLEHTVESVVTQQFTDWELLLIGQGADPDLRRVGEALARSDRRIRYLHLADRGWGRIGANFALRASVAARIGFFDEQLGAGTALPAGEDTDYMLRMEAAGVKMRCTPRAVVHHSYGRRFGLKALLANSRNYARGN